MSFESKLRENLDQWFEHKDLDYQTFLKTIVSEEEAQKIVQAHQILSEEKESFQQAKEQGRSAAQWLYSKLNQKLEPHEQINEMSLKEYASHLANTQTKPLLDSFVPEFDPIEQESKTVPQLREFFDAPFDTKQDAAIHSIAGATLYKHSKEQGKTLNPVEATVLATNGINTTKVLYQVGAQLIAGGDAKEILETQATAALATIIRTTAPKVGERAGELIGAAIGTFFHNAPVGAHIGKQVGRMAGSYVSKKANPIAKTIVKTVSSVVKKASGLLKSIWG